MVTRLLLMRLQIKSDRLTKPGPTYQPLLASLPHFSAADGNTKAAAAKMSAFKRRYKLTRCLTL